MNPGERVWVVGHLAFGLPVMARGAKGAAGVAEVGALWKKHGVNMPENVEQLAMSGDVAAIKAAAAIALRDADLPELYDAVWKKMAELAPGAGGGPPPDMPAPQPTDVVIDGDKATAKFMGDTMRFTLVDGRWFILQKIAGD